MTFDEDQILDTERSHTTEQVSYLVFDVPNIAPNAIISTNGTTGNAPLSVNFDGTASNDPDGTIVSYAWDFGDGNTAAGATTSYTYTTPGTYTAILTVTDNAGDSSSDSQTITVNSPANQLPTAMFSATPTTGDAPLNVSFNGSTSSDPDGTIVSYAWNFGDGNTSTGTTTSPHLHDAWYVHRKFDGNR